MFTIIVHFHMTDTQRYHTTEPALVLASLNMATVRDLTCERDS